MEAYFSWLHSLAAMGCRFLELPQDTKQTRRPWEAFRKCTGKRGLVLARQWLKKGSGVGFLPAGGLWVLDSDSPAMSAWIEETLLDAGIIPLAVKTQGKGKHFYFRFPEGFQKENLKNHVCHPKDADGLKVDADWKLGSRTMVVAPGTIFEGRPYQPLGPWREPPRVDPRMFLPEGQFWKKSRPFLTEDRPFKDRLARARAYLPGRAPVSVCDQGGHKVLGSVAAHLVAFLRLDPHTAASLMLRLWNGRCINPDRSPCPWTPREIQTACELAVDAIPAAGVKEWERQQRDQDNRRKLTIRVDAIKASLTTKKTAMPVALVLEWFQWLGLPNLTKKQLSDATNEAGIERARVTRAKAWAIRGLDQWRLFGELARIEHDRQESTGNLEPGNCVAKFRFPGWDRIGEPQAEKEGGFALKEEKKMSTRLDGYVDRISSTDTNLQTRAVTKLTTENEKNRGAA